MGIFDDEKIKNFLFFGFYGTNDDLNAAAPWFIVIIIIAVLVLIGLFIFT